MCLPLELDTHEIHFDSDLILFECGASSEFKVENNKHIRRRKVIVNNLQISWSKCDPGWVTWFSCKKEKEKSSSACVKNKIK